MYFPTNLAQYSAYPAIMAGGMQSRPKSGVPLSLADSDGEADIAGGSGQPSGLPNVAHFNSATSHQRTFSDHVLDNPEQFYDDTPYVPPRISQADLAYPAPNPRGCSGYDPTDHNIQQQYPFAGGNSPSDSHHSVESWSTSSSASSQHIIQNYDSGPTSQYSLTPRPPRLTSNPRHYPAYHGKQRIGLEHVHYGEHPANARESYYRTPQGYPVDGLPSTQMNYPSTSSQAYIPTVNRPSNLSSPVNDSTPSIFPDTDAYLRVQLGLSANEIVSLRSLPDPPPGEKPSTPLPTLIKLAIYGSPNKQLTLQEIYTELENRFQWFRDHKHERAWKNSIRHNLSLNQVFVHVPRPITEPGKGSYWRLDVSKGEGYKRTRKRRPRNKMIVSEEEEVSENEDDRPSPVDPSSQPAGPSQASGTPIEDATIDPELRSGHVVGEGRTRSATRRVGSGSPYPQQSPRYQPGSLPVVAGEETDAPGQPSIRFGQPSFGFPTYSKTGPMPLVDVPSILPSSSMTMMITAPTTGPQLQNAPSYDQAIDIAQPTPRAGIEFLTDPRSLAAARRVTTFPEPRESTHGNAPHSSPESSSSGSSRTWRDPRSGS